MEAERGKDVLDRPQKPYKDKDNPPSPVGWRQAERTWPGSSQRWNKMENSDPEAAKDGMRWRTLTRKQPRTEQDGELWPGSSLKLPSSRTTECNVFKQHVITDTGLFLPPLPLWTSVSAVRQSGHEAEMLLYVHRNRMFIMDVRKPR